MTKQPTEGKFVNTLLAPEQLADLELVQRHHGLANRGETIRLLIRQEARRIQQAADDPGRPRPQVL